MPESINIAEIAGVLGDIDVLTLLLSFMILCMALILRRLNRRMQMIENLLKDSESQLNHALQRINRLEDHQMSDRSSPEIYRAAVPKEDLLSRLQSKPRSGDAPNRYRHVASLTQQGLNAEQIAEVLHISVAETSQLMSLVRLAQVDTKS